MELFIFQGRASRRTYALHKLVEIAVFVAMYVLLVYPLKRVKFSSDDGFLIVQILIVAIVALLADDVCVTVRRLHDLDRPSSHYFLLFVPLYGLFFLVRLFAERGTDGPNSFDIPGRGLGSPVNGTPLVPENIPDTQEGNITHTGAILSSRGNEAPRLYSIFSMGIATLLGSFFAGAVLMSRNFARSGNEDAARKTAVLTLLLLVMGALLPLVVPFPDISIKRTAVAMEMIQLGLVLMIAIGAQGQLLKRHGDNGGTFFAWWRAAALSLLILPVVVGVFYGMTTGVPNLFALGMKDEFVIRVHMTAQDKDQFTERKVAGLQGLPEEVSGFGWIDQLRQANTFHRATPSIAVLNPRLDRSLTIRIHGKPDDFVFHCFWEHTSFHRGGRVLGVYKAQRIPELFSLLFERKTADLDNLFDGGGITTEEYDKVFKESEDAN